MMVLDAQGAILYLTDEAQRLLALICHPVLALDLPSQETKVMAKLAELCGNLKAIAEGKHANPPSWCHTTGRGRFTFRAYWLEGVNREANRMVSMTIEHQEPLNLKVLRAMQDLPLSPMQKQVALLVAQGYSNDLIGAHLHIKLNTVKEHVSNVFDKLGIGRREELLPLLLTMDNPGRS